MKVIEFEREFVTLSTPWHVEPPPDVQAPYGEIRGVRTDDEFIVLWGGDAFVYFMVFPIHEDPPECFSKIQGTFQPWATTALWSEAEWSFGGRVKFDGSAYKHEYCSNFDAKSLAHDADVAALVFRMAWEIFSAGDTARYARVRDEFLSPNHEFVERESTAPYIASGPADPC
jgi:hypothetical protein